MRLRALFLVPLALALQIASARSESVVRTVGGVDFNLTVPNNYCALGEEDKRDAVFINAMSTLLRNSGNRLILVMMECEHLKTWRAGVNGPVLDYVTYYIPIANEAATLPGDPQSFRKAICDSLRKQGDFSAALDKAKESVAQSAKELQANIAINNSRFIGVLDEDEHGCYAGLLVGVKGEQTSVVLSAVVMSTVIHAKPLLISSQSRANCKCPRPKRPRSTRIIHNSRSRSTISRRRDWPRWRTPI
jgi:hypothetical protein